MGDDLHEEVRGGGDLYEEVGGDLCEEVRSGG